MVSFRRRQMLAAAVVPGGGGDGINIPTLFQRVEYIDNHGQLYIDTGLVTDLTSEMIMSVTMEADSLTGYHGGNGNMQIQCFGNVIPQTNTKYTVVRTQTPNVGGIVTTDGVVTDTDGYYTYSNMKIGVFALYDSNGFGNITDCKVYDVSIIIDGVEVRHLIPCYRKSDGKTGFWDVVGWQFYTNVNPSFTSEFGVGPDVIQPATQYIIFVDRAVEAICVQNWGDGVGITYSQAAAVTVIGQNAFMQNTQITSFDELRFFSNPALDIAGYAFYGCSNLTSMELPQNLQTIPAHCFNGAGLTGDITIPASVTYISGACFWNTAITSITCLATTPPTMESSFFPSTVTAIYVPAGSVAAYQAANNWSGYASIIQAIS